MNAFTYSYPITVYFGEKAAEKNLPAELSKVGKNVMLAYGGGSIKRNGVFEKCGKERYRVFGDNVKSDLQKGSRRRENCP